MLDIKVIHKELKRLGFYFNGGRKCRFYWNTEDMYNFTEGLEFINDTVSGGWFSFSNKEIGNTSDEAYNLELKEVAKDYIIVGYPDHDVLDIKLNRVKRVE